MTQTPLRTLPRSPRRALAPWTLMALGLVSAGAWSQSTPAVASAEPATHTAGALSTIEPATLKVAVAEPDPAPAAIDSVTLETRPAKPAAAAPAPLALAADTVASLNLGANVADWKYTPRAASEKWVEKGVASWYGNAFHGKRTASGEVFNQFGMTAAHKTLPIPSYVRVKNVRNGREVIVRINDRGPFHPGRVIDLSYAAAQKLGSVNQPANVVIEPIDPDSVREGEWQPLALPPNPLQKTARAPAPEAPHARRSPGESAVASNDPAVRAPSPERAVAKAGANAPASVASTDKLATGPLKVLSAERAPTTPGRGWWLQLGAFENQDGADLFYKQVGKALKGAEPLVTMFQEKMLHKVKVGPFETRDEASTFGKRVRELLSLSPMLVRRQ